MKKKNVLCRLIIYLNESHLAAEKGNIQANIFNITSDSQVTLEVSGLKSLSGFIKPLKLTLQGHSRLLSISVLKKGTINSFIISFHNT